MSPLSKKRRAYEADGPEAAQTAPKPPKKSKQAAAPDGQDDDGNPFWEVRARPGPLPLPLLARSCGAGR